MYLYVYVWVCTFLFIYSVVATSRCVASPAGTESHSCLQAILLEKLLVDLLVCLCSVDIERGHIQNDANRGGSYRGIGAAHCETPQRTETTCYVTLFVLHKTGCRTPLAKEMLLVGCLKSIKVGQGEANRLAAG